MCKNEKFKSKVCVFNTHDYFTEKHTNLQLLPPLGTDTASVLNTKIVYVGNKAFKHKPNGF